MPARGTDLISPHFLMRLLIVSYFVALSFQLTPGADIHQLADPFMLPAMSHFAVRGVLLTLSAMILFDVHRRAAALVLSILVFLSSYITMLMGGDVGEFWLTLALIGGLLHAGGVGAARKAEPEVTDQEPVPHPTRRTSRTKSSSGRDLPYRKDLEVVREH